MKRRSLYHALRAALRGIGQSGPASSPAAAIAIWQWMIFGALLALVTGCSLLKQRVLVKPEVIEIAREVRAPLPPALLQSRPVYEPDAACWLGTGRVYCNGQLALMLTDYRAALGQCNADKAALRDLDARQREGAP